MAYGTAPRRVSPGVWVTSTGRALTPAGSDYWERKYRSGLTDGMGHMKVVSAPEPVTNPDNTVTPTPVHTSKGTENFVPIKVPGGTSLQSVADVTARTQEANQSYYRHELTNRKPDYQRDVQVLGAQGAMELDAARKRFQANARAVHAAQVESQSRDAQLRKVSEDVIADKLPQAQLKSELDALHLTREEQDRFNQMTESSRQQQLAERGSNPLSIAGNIASSTVNPGEWIAGAVGGAVNLKHGDTSNPWNYANIAGVIPFLRGPKAIAEGVRAAHAAEAGSKLSAGTAAAGEAYRTSTPIITAGRATFGSAAKHLRKFDLGNADYAIPGAGSRSGRLMERFMDEKLRPLLNRGGLLYSPSERGHLEQGHDVRLMAGVDTAQIKRLVKVGRLLTRPQEYALRIVLNQVPPAERLAEHIALGKYWGGQAGDEAQKFSLYHEIHADLIKRSEKYIDVVDDPVKGPIAVLKPDAPKRLHEAYDRYLEVAGQRQDLINQLGLVQDEQVAEDIFRSRIFNEGRFFRGARWVSHEQLADQAIEQSPVFQKMMASLQQQGARGTEVNAWKAIYKAMVRSRGQQGLGDVLGHVSDIKHTNEIPPEEGGVPPTPTPPETPPSENGAVAPRPQPPAPRPEPQTYEEKVARLQELQDAQEKLIDQAAQSLKGGIPFDRGETLFRNEQRARVKKPRHGRSVEGGQALSSVGPPTQAEELRQMAEDKLDALAESHRGEAWADQYVARREEISRLKQEVEAEHPVFGDNGDVLHQISTLYQETGGLPEPDWPKRIDFRAMARRVIKTGHKLPPGMEDESVLAAKLKQVYGLIREGAPYRDWYVRAAAVFTDAATRLGLDPKTFLKLVAMYSAQANPTENFRRALQAVREYKEHGSVLTPGVGVQREKAVQILRDGNWTSAKGQAEDLVGSVKTPSFYANLLEESLPKEFEKDFGGQAIATIDRHIGTMFGVDPDKYYGGLSEVFHEFGRALGWKSSEAQAAAWVPWKARAMAAEQAGKHNMSELPDYRKYMSTAADAYESGQKKYRDVLYQQFGDLTRDNFEIHEHDGGTAVFLKDARTGAPLKVGPVFHTSGDRAAAEQWIDQKLGQEALAQRGGEVPGPSRYGVKGYTKFEGDKAEIGLTEHADQTTLPHEIMHVFRRYGLTKSEETTLAKWAGAEGTRKKGFLWSRQAEENVARAWEAFLYRGAGPKGLKPQVRTVSKSFRDIYEQGPGAAAEPNARGMNELPDITPAVDSVFKRMLRYKELKGGKFVGAEDTQLGLAYTPSTRGIPSPMRQKAAALGAYSRRALGVISPRRGQAMSATRGDKALENVFKAHNLYTGFFTADLIGPMVERAMMAQKISVFKIVHNVLKEAGTETPKTEGDIAVWKTPQKHTKEAQGRRKQLQRLFDEMSSEGDKDALTKAFADAKVDFPLLEQFKGGLLPGEINGVPVSQVASEIIAGTRKPIKDLVWVDPEAFEKSALTQVWGAGKTMANMSKKGRKHWQALGLTVDSINDLQKALILYLNPAYIPVNLIGNLGMNLLHQGIFMPRNLMNAVKMHASLDPLERQQIDEGMGSGLVVSLGMRTSPGQILHRTLGHWINLVIDLIPRRAAWLHEAYKAGYNSPEAIKELLKGVREGDEAARADFLGISRLGRDAIVDYDRMSPAEKQYVARVIFFYPWLRGSTRYSARFIVDHPIQAAALALMYEHAQVEAQKQLGERPDYASLEFPISTKTLGLRVPGTNLDVGLDKAVGDHTWKDAQGHPMVENIRQAFTSTTSLELAQVLGHIVFNHNVNAVRDAASMLAPAPYAAGAALFGYDPFTRKEVPPGVQTFFESFGPTKTPAWNDYERIKMSPEERKRYRARAINPRSKGQEEARTVLGGLAPAPYAPAVGAERVLSTKGAYERNLQHLIQDAKKLHMGYPPPEVISDLKVKTQLDHQIHANQSWGERYDIIAKLFDEKYGQNMSAQKPPTEGIAHHMYTTLERLLYPAYNSWAGIIGRVKQTQQEAQPVG